MTTPEAMACQELIELVTEHLEGTLGEAERRRFEEHLAGCAHCLEYLHQIRTTVQLSRFTRSPASAAVPAELMAMFRESQRGG